MDKNCKFAGAGDCLCSACQSIRKALEEAERINPEEIDGAFQEAEKILEEFKNFDAN